MPIVVIHKSLNMKFSALTLSIAALALLSSCGDKNHSEKVFDKDIYTPQYAAGFAISGSDSKQSTVITVYNPWQGADSVVTELYIERDEETAPIGFTGQILKGEAHRIVAMSSTHVAMLDAIGEVDRIVGVSGLDYISNRTIQAKRNIIGDVGYDANVNYEVLLSLSPDLVLLYGVNGASSMEAKLKELGIPFMYVGDYLEESPLGKAEWLVALSEVVGKRDFGIEKFKQIPIRYNTIKDLAKSVVKKPTVMLNTPYSDSWFMPSDKSYMVQLINDAGGKYVYTKNSSTSSLPIDMEEAYSLTFNADRWINVGTMTGLDEIRNSYPKFADTKPVVTGEVYNSNKRTNANGANDFWESGVVNPDLVLRDLLKIMHPDLVDEDFVYYQKLK
jgi:iron complex transport system substrate-binding protein